MSFPLPRSLSPSKVSNFTSCALAFRFSAIDRLPQPPTEATVRGRVVHAALERLFSLTPVGERGREIAKAHLDDAWESMQEEISELSLDQEHQRALRSKAETLVESYFDMEDPNLVEVAGVELSLETDLGGVHFRGIIDRLDVSPNGDLIVTDYKTGRPPGPAFEKSSLVGVMYYALLCEEALGKRPVELRLYYLRPQPVVISAKPSQQSLKALRAKTTAIWSAIERACEREDFRPRQSALCQWCAWKQYCPAFGGDPASVPTSRRIGMEPVPLLP